MRRRENGHPVADIVQCGLPRANDSPNRTYEFSQFVDLQVIDFIELTELAPRAGFEPATLRLTGWCRWAIVLILRGFSSTETVLVPGVREQIVHGLIAAAQRLD